MCRLYEPLAAVFSLLLMPHRPHFSWVRRAALLHNAHNISHFFLLINTLNNERWDMKRESKTLPLKTKTCLVMHREEVEIRWKDFVGHLRVSFDLKFLKMSKLVELCWKYLDFVGFWFENILKTCKSIIEKTQNSRHFCFKVFNVQSFQKSSHVAPFKLI